MFWLAGREEEAMLLSVSETGWLQSVYRVFQTAKVQRFQTGLLCFQASASASIYKDPAEEADTRIMRRSALEDKMGAPFDGTSFDGTSF